MKIITTLLLTWFQNINMSKNRFAKDVPTCPRCGHPDYKIIEYAIDGRPRFKCNGDCDNSWTSGKSGEPYITYLDKQNIET